MQKVINLADGNPGAMAFISALMHPSIPGKTLSTIENSGIVGADLYVLWSDLCGKDMNKVIKLVDKCPLDILKDACSRQDYSGRKLVAEYLKD
jgi:hypothetical protein